MENDKAVITDKQILRTHRVALSKAERAERVARLERRCERLEENRRSGMNLHDVWRQFTAEGAW